MYDNADGMIMITLYHGTRYENALQIARDGALLSPFERFVHEVLRYNPHFSRLDAEEQAEQYVQSMYAEHELYQRGQCISLTEDFELAKHYAFNYEGPKLLGGIVFEFVRDDFEPTWLKGSVICVPKRFSLDGLAGIHFTPQAWKRKNYNRLTEVFEQYNADYFRIY